MPGLVLACLGYFWLILLRSCLFQLVAVGSGLFHILQKKERHIKARQKLETLKKEKARKEIKARKVRQKRRAHKAHKK